MANGYGVGHDRYKTLPSSQEIIGQSYSRWLKLILVKSCFLLIYRDGAEVTLTDCMYSIVKYIYIPSHVTFINEINFRNFIFCSPKCRFEYKRSDTPSRYYCYCGKVEDPPLDPWLVPHSCGQVCERDFKPSCGHKCLLLCHPGELYIIFFVICG